MLLSNIAVKLQGSIVSIKAESKFYQPRIHHATHENAETGNLLWAIDFA